jgi:hypothetical protein
LAQAVAVLQTSAAAVAVDKLSIQVIPQSQGMSLFQLVLEVALVQAGWAI